MTARRTTHCEVICPQYLYMLRTRLSDQAPCQGAARPETCILYTFHVTAAPQRQVWHLLILQSIHACRFVRVVSQRWTITFSYTVPFMATTQRWD